MEWLLANSNCSEIGTSKKSVGIKNQAVNPNFSISGAATSKLLLNPSSKESIRPGLSYAILCLQKKDLDLIDLH